MATEFKIFAPVNAVDWSRPANEGGGYVLDKKAEGADALTAIIKSPNIMRVYAAENGNLSIIPEFGMIQIEAIGANGQPARRWRYFDVGPVGISDVDGLKPGPIKAGSLIGFSNGPDNTFRFGVIVIGDGEATAQFVDPVAVIQAWPKGEVGFVDAETVEQALKQDTVDGLPTSEMVPVDPDAPAMVTVAPGTITVKKVALGLGIVGTLLVGLTVGAVVFSKKKSRK
jgi:hypothetical protein